MPKADRVHSTPSINTPISQVDATSRRRFLSLAAGVAAGGTVLALATFPPALATVAPASPLDPVYGLIEAHRQAQAAHIIALAEQDRLERIGDPAAGGIAEGPCHADMDAFNDLIETAPTTFAGLVAWASYLDEIGKVDPYLFGDEGRTLVVVLVEALGNLQVAS
jgi:hypothetical protein